MIKLPSFCCYDKPICEGSLTIYKSIMRYSEAYDKAYRHTNYITTVAMQEMTDRFVQSLYVLQAGRFS